MLQEVDGLFSFERLGAIMGPDPVDPREACGVLNPACARSGSGELLLFPRVVAPDNYSRIGIAKVRFDTNDNPCTVERLGYALEPNESYEQNRLTAGCEDARVTQVAALGAYVMTYTAYGPLGPRIALATSHDLMNWRRLGLAKFASGHGVEFDLYSNKDAVVFPDLITDPAGRLSVGLLHRPTYDLAHSCETAYCVVPQGVRDARPSIWLSYCPIDALDSSLDDLVYFRHHRLVAVPEQPWEQLKIGAGTPPVPIPQGWLVLFHGVSTVGRAGGPATIRYCAGALVLDRIDPTRVLYRSTNPILEPATRDELHGVVDNVVFPTALDLRAEERADIYYGMADYRIGVGTLHIPESLPVAVDKSAAA
jgi:predicted GH43/DUF377 family glycosyl hydrolase